MPLKKHLHGLTRAEELQLVEAQEAQLVASRDLLGCTEHAVFVIRAQPVLGVSDFKL